MSEDNKTPKVNVTNKPKTKKRFTKLEGGKEVTDMIELDEFLDDEIENLSEALDKAQAEAIDQYNIQMVTDEVIEFKDAITGRRIWIMGICRLDDKYYAAMFDPDTGKKYTEEVHVGVINGFQTQIKAHFFIEDPNEWSVISEFFNRHHVFEYHGIIDWDLQTKPNKIEDLIATAAKLQFLDKINKDRESKHKKPITPEQIALRNLARRNIPKIG